MIRKIFWGIIIIALIIAWSGDTGKSTAFVGQAAKATAAVVPAVVGGVILIVTALGNGFKTPTTTPAPQKPAPRTTPAPVVPGI